MQAGDETNDGLFFNLLQHRSLIHYKTCNYEDECTRLERSMSCITDFLPKIDNVPLIRQSSDYIIQ